MQGLTKALASRDQATFDGAWPQAEQELEQVFSPDVWGIRPWAEEYSDTNYSTIWNHELRRRAQHVLEEGGVDKFKFAEWLGAMHYVSVAIYRKVLFDPYQDNRGWRLLILSVPPVSAGAVGLASHYQNAQNHDHLAKVSGLLFDHVAAAAQQAHLQLPGRKVSKSDWTSDSLFPRPIVDVDGADLSGVPGDGRLLMRDVRTTTVKKVLASMISVQPFDLEDSTGAALAQALPQLEAIGRLIA